MTPLTEKELIHALCQREEAAFRQLVGQFQDKVFNTALGFLQNQADAEDLAQEVFIQVYRSITTFKGNASLSTWIYRITVTKSLDLLRSRKRKKRFGFMSSLLGKDNRILYDPADPVHPGIQQDRKEEAAILFRLVDTLPKSQRIAFLLNKIEELSYREIAQILNTTESAIDSLLQRAKQNLRKKIKNLPP